MRGEVDRAPFAAAVMATTRGFAAHPANPLLSGVELRVADDRLEVRGFDYEVATKLTLPADASDAGRVLVNGRLLTEICRTLAAERVTLDAGGSTLSVRCGAARFELSLVPLDEYPEPPEQPPAFGSVSPAALRTAVAQVSIAAGRDDALPSLTGIRLEARPRGLTLVATDRYRIAESVLPWLDEGPATEIATLLPARTLDHLAKVLAAPSAGTAAATEHAGPDAVTLGFHATESGGWFGALRGDGRSVRARPIDAPFVRHDRFWPETHTSLVEVDLAALAGAVRRVTVVSERYTPIRLRCEDDVVRLAAHGDGADRASEDVPATLAGEPIEIGFNPTYLLDALREITAPRVRLYFTTPSRPAVVAPAPASDEATEPASTDVIDAADVAETERLRTPTFRHLVMSMRLSEG